MFSVTPIGSCRITTPLKRGKERFGFRLNMDKCYGYCHSPAEAVQMARFMLGQITIPSDVWPLVSRAHDLHTLQSSIHALSDLYVVELASAKEVTIDGVSVQLNYLNSTYADFFANKERAFAFWEIAEVGSQDQMQRFLADAWSSTPSQVAQSKMLGRIAMRRVTQDSLENDLRTLKSLLTNVLVVSHIDAVKADGQKISSRSEFIGMVQAATLATQTPFDNPTDLMARFGQSEAIEDESAGLAHFTSQFGATLMQHWIQTVIAPMTDVAVIRDDAAIKAWLIPQIVAACENGHIAHAYARVEALAPSEQTMRWLAQELADIKAMSEANFQAATTAAMQTGLDTGQTLDLIVQANGLGLPDVALTLAQGLDGGIAQMPKHLALQLAETAAAAGALDSAVAFLRPVLLRGDAAAAEIFATICLQSGRDLTSELPQDLSLRLLGHLKMAQRIALVALMGRDMRYAISAQTSADDVVLAAEQVQAHDGLEAAAKLVAYWRKLRGQDTISEASLVDMLDTWVATAMSQTELSDRIASLSLTLRAAPRFAPARDAARDARKDLVAQIRAVGDVIRDHRTTGGTVIGKATRLCSLPAQHGFFPRINVGQATAAKRTSGGVKVDVVLHLAIDRVEQSQLDHVTLVADNQRAGHRAVIGQRPNFGTCVFVHNHQHFGGFHCDLDDLRAARGNLLVGRGKWRCDQFHLNAGVSCQIRRGRFGGGLLFGRLGEIGHWRMCLWQWSTALASKSSATCHGSSTGQNRPAQHIAAACWHEARINYLRHCLLQF